MVCVSDALEEGALPGFPGHDEGVSVSRGEPVLLLVEAELSLALGGVHPMAFEAGIGQDGPDLTSKLDLCSGLKRSEKPDEAYEAGERTGEFTGSGFHW